ncbi:HAD family hydrolase [Paenibacillus sp. DYY-L-2]|uniref:HAD family hydrolase n=1 Tax=Paenibacillus sp. DYY-L-2 TaxID=3447013 RepID=UPI003F50B359
MMQAFIFDMDGVIIDSEPIHFEVDLMTLDDLGVKLGQKDLEPYVGMTNPEMWALIREKHNLSHSVEEIIDYQLTKKLDYLNRLEIEPIDGIRQLIKQLHRAGIPAGVASSSPRVFIESVLKKFNLFEEFCCITSGEEMAKGKPAPDIYLEAARLMNVRPENCVVLEDSRNGVVAAKSAGMRCIGFINPNSGNQDLSLADFVVSSISEIDIHML